MTPSDKQFWQYSIVRKDTDYAWDFNTDYFELSYNEVYRLYIYATLFGMKSTNGMTKARKLWYRCQQVHRQRPF